jgi:hypothetical protein
VVPESVGLLELVLPDLAEVAYHIATVVVAVVVGIADSYQKTVAERIEVEVGAGVAVVGIVVEQKLAVEVQELAHIVVAVEKIVAEVEVEVEVEVVDIVVERTIVVVVRIAVEILVGVANTVVG